jgi:hypothetical protein
LYKRVRLRNHSLLPSVSVVSLSQCGGTLDFLLKKQPPYFSNIGETPVLDISNLQELPGFTEEPVVIWRSQICLWTMGYVSEKLGVWCFLRTANRSLQNRGDIRKYLVAGSNTHPTIIYIHLGVLGDCVFLYPQVISRLSLQIGR